MGLQRGMPIGRDPAMVRRARSGNTPHQFGVRRGEPGNGGPGGAAGGGGGGGLGGLGAAGGSGGSHYPLAGLLRCAACQLPLNPVDMLGGRAYGSPCGCRLTVIAAEILERLVLDAVATREPAAVVEAERGDPAWVFRRFLAEVRIGASFEDLDLIWRT
jgi:hypothetical protein